MGQILNRLKRIIEAEKNFPDSDNINNNSDDELKRIIEELNKKTSKEEESNKNKSTNSENQKTEAKSEDLNIANAYKTLGIKSDSSNEEIRAAYLTKIKEYHPDKVQNLGEEIRLLAERKTVEINRAYDYIKSKRNIK